MLYSVPLYPRKQLRSSSESTSEISVLWPALLLIVPRHIRVVKVYHCMIYAVRDHYVNFIM